MRGLVGGLLWGFLVAGLGLGVLSVLAPLPGEAPRGPTDVVAAGDSGEESEDQAVLPTEPDDVPVTGASENAPPADLSGVDAEHRNGSVEEELASGLDDGALTQPEQSDQNPQDLGPMAATEGAQLFRPAEAVGADTPRIPSSETGKSDEPTVPDRPVEPGPVDAGILALAEAPPSLVEAEIDPGSLTTPSAPVPEARRPNTTAEQSALLPKEPAPKELPEGDPRPVSEAAPPPLDRDRNDIASDDTVAATTGNTSRDEVGALQNPSQSGPTAEGSSPMDPIGEDGRVSESSEAPEPDPSKQESEDPVDVVVIDTPQEGNQRPADAVPVRRPAAGVVQDRADTAQPGLRSSVEGVTTGRLPRIAPVDGQGGPLPARETVDAGSAQPTGAEAPAYIQFARPFENPQSKPLFSIILRDLGGPDIDREALAALPFPVSFAIDPTLPDAENAANIYRMAGQEVLMLASGLPQGATAADIEVTFGVHARVLQEAVAVLDQETGGIQGNRSLAQQVLAVIKGQERGAVSWERGLNAFSQIARREGMRNAVIFRSLDSDDEAGPVIRRYLDRAAFKAAQDGRVVVAGTTRPETVTAILEWTVEGRADTVALAPVTAAMTSQ